jgi:hypothetical protein
MCGTVVSLAIDSCEHCGVFYKIIGLSFFVGIIQLFNTEMRDVNGKTELGSKN